MISEMGERPHFYFVVLRVFTYYALMVLKYYNQRLNFDAVALVCHNGWYV